MDNGVAFILGFLCSFFLTVMTLVPAYLRCVQRRKEIEQMMADHCARYLCGKNGK